MAYADILLTMTGPPVLAPSQVLLPVVLTSPLASVPAAATPASVCCLTQHDIVCENSSLRAIVISLHVHLSHVQVNLYIFEKHAHHTYASLHVCGYVHLLSCVCLCVHVANGLCQCAC